ncbi:MAG: response regulator transcription factor [bacterium]
MPDFIAPVAIVDDDAPVRRALLRLLRSEGLQGVAFASANEFLLALQGACPSCVIVDLHMPNVDGFELQQQLARDWPRLPVILMTGQNSPEIEAHVQVAHPVAILLKPIDSEVLIRTIRSVMV